MIPVSEPSLDGNERQYLLECIESGWISSEGPFVARLEAGLAERVGRRHGVAVCNGTAALELAVRVLELEPGDEVILPSFTIISCALAVIRAGATPVVVDSNPETWNMDPRAVAKAITGRTRAIMMVHIYGLPCEVDPLLALARQHRLHVIEDASQLLGQHYRDRPCGSFGDISTFSFYPNKLLTTGEGGMVVMDDASLAEHCRSLRNLSFGQRQRFVHEEIGSNYRMSNLQAALGVAQLERLDGFVRRKREIGDRYTERLRETKGLQLPLDSTHEAQNIYWVYGVVLARSSGLDMEGCMQQLAERGIQTRPFFWGMHEQPALRRLGLFEGVECPVAERLARRGFYLPSGMTTTDEQIDTVSKAVRELIG